MNGNVVPAALREQLGPEATGGLLEVLESARWTWKDDVIAVCAERFERRLVGEVSQLRVEMVRGDAAIRQEMTQTAASLRQEMAELGSTLRQEMAQLGAGLRQEMSAGRFELLKWCFVFWVGQVVAIGGVMSLMLRILRP